MTAEIEAYRLECDQRLLSEIHIDNQYLPRQSGEERLWLQSCIAGSEALQEKRMQSMWSVEADHNVIYSRLIVHPDLTSVWDLYRTLNR